ncbi:Pectinesterase [Hallella bergensis DSM 17361]|uniref:Pectinesterase n=1 Tax=Hallella bergensis DSM 17361 TaxID=585502 RepID=D1PX87_9BACT|nr:pectinesterase family protein [Hallella bergensis]EFA44047.1 Pectinesterase [Hallella bergensis DSM 17361]
MKSNLKQFALLCLLLMVAIAAKAGDVTATWDFKSMAAGAVHYEGNTGTVASDVEGVELTVDATNKGKLKSRGSDAQFNKNTIIRIPVKSTRDHVSIISYPGYHNYTVDGTAADADTVRHKATTQEVASGYVEVVGTGGSYLYKIQVTHVSPLQEKVIYETDFTNWEAIDRKANNETPTVVNLSTKYSHEDFTFTLCGVGADPEGTNNKFPDITGYMISAKYTNEVSAHEPYAMTSALANVTKIVFHQTATGSNRGWAVAARTAGSDQWEVIYNQSIGNARGEDVTVEVNRENVELKFYNFNQAQNAYMTALHIYGNVDMSQAPALATFTANGTTYQAADVFDQDEDGNFFTTVEVSKSEMMVDADHPITATAQNGTLGEISYKSVPSTDNGDKPAADVIIPIVFKDATAQYTIHFVWKPDFTVNYYDADGTTKVASQTVEKDAVLGKLNDGSTVTVPEGSKFRGWLFKPRSDEKAKATTVVTDKELNLYALVTDIEGDEANERNVYDLKNKYFYVEDHEAFVPTSTYSYNGAQHGLYLKPGSVKLLVGGNATIIIEACKYNKAPMTLTDASGNTLGTIDVPENDGEKTTLKYNGKAGELILSFDGEVYLHALTIINTGTSDIAKNSDGYYVAEPGNGNSFLNILDIIEANEDGSSRVKIFLPDGVYDLGQKVKTEFPVDNLSIIGQSMDNTIIVTAPDFTIEGLGSADMFYNKKQNIYFQDLTLKNALDYYGSGAAGRAAVIQDRGNRTIYKNVRMLSYQDTYYSQNASMQSYFADCDVHGTVDFICGGGDVRFQNTTLSLEPRNQNGTGGRTITAPTTTTNFGYVFDGCKIVDLANGKGDWNFGRTWQNEPICVFLNTTLDANAEATLIGTRWIERGMNNKDPKVFGEFGTKNENGDDITPASNKISSYTVNLETVLSETKAAAYAYDKMYTDWDPRALSDQLVTAKATVSNGTLSWEPVTGATAYAVFKNNVFQAIVTQPSFAGADDTNTWSVRAANPMGGFGEPVKASVVNAVADISADKVVSTSYYSMNGTKLIRLQQGVNLRVSHLSDGTTITDKVVVK